MSHKNLAMILLTVVLLTGCAHFDVKKDFTQRDSREIAPNKGYVVFSDFDIPQPVTRSFRVNTGTWTANPTTVTIFDVTEDLKYVGYVWVYPPVYKRISSFTEQSFSEGKHTFMLIFKTKFWGIPVESFTDFIEVNITKENTTHIAISYYPYKKALLGDWILQPKFTQVLMNDKDFDFCSQTISDKELREQNVSNYMQHVSIASTQKYFQSYCESLASDQKMIFSLNEKSKEDFEKEKAEIEMVKNRDFQKWQNSKNKNKVFSLIQPEWVLQQKTK